MAESRARFPETYENVLVGPLFAPWADALLDRVPLAAGSRFLDLACGTGILARRALARLGAGAHVVGVDRSPGMLAMARTAAPEIEWIEGDATQLPFAAGKRFDIAGCHQGLQFFADRVAAMREIHRVLTAGGRVALGVWRSVEENGLFCDLDAVAARHVGPIEDTRFAFGDIEQLRSLVVDAGFTDVRVEAASREVSFGVVPDVLARINARGAVGMSAAAAATPVERERLIEAIVDDSLPAVRRYMRGESIVFPTSANLATAVKP